MHCARASGRVCYRRNPTRQKIDQRNSCLRICYSVIFRHTHYYLSFRTIFGCSVLFNFYLFNEQMQAVDDKTNFSREEVRKISKTKSFLIYLYSSETYERMIVNM